MPKEETTLGRQSTVEINMQLSLKNIYRLLSMQDYPLPTPSVFPPNTWRGVTVVSFWRDVFHAAFPPEIPLDIFDTDDKRSRALSILLNSAGGTGFRKKLFTALSANLTPELLLQLTIVWMSFLTNEQYASSALTQRLESLIRLLEAGISAEIACAAHLNALMEDMQRSDRQSIPPLFQHALVLAWLTIHALYIARREDPALIALRINGAASPAVLYDRYIIQSRSGKLVDITNRNCVLCISPVQAENYVGHSALLAEAAERLGKYGKLLISGIGGSGKSEFARQLLQRFTTAGCYDRAAYVQYYCSLAESFRNAFPDLSATSDGAVIEECRRMLESQDSARTLLMIDNMNQTTSEDAALAQLCAYGCHVVITSRLVALDGFDVLPVPSLSPEDSQRLFRIHLQHAQEKQDLDLAQLCASVQGHPLSLVLFAGLCRSKYWSVAKLNEKLQANGFDGLSFVRNGVRATISESFSAVFDCAALENWERKLLRLIAMLPYIFYLPCDLAPLAMDVTADQDELCDYLQLLADRSWLTQSAQGYLMHPVIAETLRLIPASCDDYPLLWKRWNAPDVDDAIASLIRKEQPMILEALRHTSPLNSDGFEAMIKTEQSMISGAFTPAGRLLLKKHREYLDTHPHSSKDEVLFRIHHAYISVMDDDLPGFRQQIEQLTALPLNDLDAWTFYPSLCNVIEFACGLVDKQFLNQIYAAIRPRDESCPNMICYLNSLCCKFRNSDGDLPQAVKAAHQSLALIEKLGMENSISASGCYVRYAYCLADQGRRADAAPHLKRALDVMASHGYQDTSPTMMQTRTAYALMLVDTGDKQRAIDEYLTLQHLYKSQYQTESSGYAQLLCNMAMLLSSMGQHKKAEAAVREAIAIDERINNTKGLCGRRFRNLGEILSNAGHHTSALTPLLRARPLLAEAFGEASFDAAYCDALIAREQLASGVEVTVALADATQILLSSLGENHPYTKTALALQHNA